MIGKLAHALIPIQCAQRLRCCAVPCRAVPVRAFSVKKVKILHNCLTDRLEFYPSLFPVVHPRIIQQLAGEKKESSQELSPCRKSSTQINLSRSLHLQQRGSSDFTSERPICGAKTRPIPAARKSSYSFKKIYIYPVRSSQFPVIGKQNAACSKKRRKSC